MSDRIANSAFDAPPTFSVIVPVYNTADHVEACVRSLLGQTFGDLEVIAIDDGSTDESRSILNKLAEGDHRLRILSQANGGQGAARNHGLAAARGHYVAFVDSDDTVAPKFLELMASLLNGAEPDVISFRIQFRDEFDRVVAVRGPARKFRSEGREIFLDAMLDRKFLSSVCNKVYRRALLVDHAILFPEIRAYEDSIFSRHVARYAQSVQYLNEDLYFALTRSGSTSRRMTEESFIRAAEMLAIERKLFATSFADGELDSYFCAHAAHFLAYLLVLAAFRIDDKSTRSSCRRIADEAGFLSYARNRKAMALLSTKAKSQVFLARNPRLLRGAALFVRRLNLSPY